MGDRRGGGGESTKGWEVELSTAGASLVKLERSVGTHLVGSNSLLPGRNFRGGRLSSSKHRFLGRQNQLMITAKSEDSP